MECVALMTLPGLVILLTVLGGRSSPSGGSAGNHGRSESSARCAAAGPALSRVAPVQHLTVPTDVLRRGPAVGQDGAMSVVKINVLTVPAEQRETLEKRFASRAHAVENSDGFEWFELLRPVEGTDNYLVYTRWRDEESFKAWMEGPMKEAHQGAANDRSLPRVGRRFGPSRSCNRRPRKASSCPQDRRPGCVPRSSGASGDTLRLAFADRASSGMSIRSGVGAAFIAGRVRPSLATPPSRSPSPANALTERTTP